MKAECIGAEGGQRAWVLERKTCLLNVYAEKDPFRGLGIVGIPEVLAEELDGRGVDELHFHLIGNGERRLCQIDFSDYVIHGGSVEKDGARYLACGLEHMTEVAKTKAAAQEDWKTRWNRQRIGGCR